MIDERPAGRQTSVFFLFLVSSFLFSQSFTLRRKEPKQKGDKLLPVVLLKMDRELVEFGLFLGKKVPFSGENALRGGTLILSLKMTSPQRKGNFSVVRPFLNFLPATNRELVSGGQTGIDNYDYPIMFGFPSSLFSV